MVVRTLAGGISGDLRDLDGNFGHDNDVVTVLYDPISYDYQIFTRSGADKINLQNANANSRHDVYAGAGRDSVYGGAGIDVVYDQSGNDLFTLGGGIDIYRSGNGDDTARGGSGSDRIEFNYLTDNLDNFTRITKGITCDLAKIGVQNFGIFGKDVISGFENVVGGDGADRFFGSAAANVLDGSGGNDVLNGRDGTDYLFGGDGRDSLFGGNGMDSLDGGTGKDSLSSGDGDDSLTGDEADDRLFGGAGSDYFFGGAGNDTQSGGAGRDTLYGGSDHDILSGGSGNDTLSGIAGNDTLTGDGGNDSLFGGEGKDVLSGGSAVDYLNGDNGEDRFIGGGGADAFSLIESIAACDVVVFTRLSDSDTGNVTGTIDEIRYFDQGGTVTDDLIDLRAIDANPDRPGNQAFLFRGTGNFNSPSGEVRLIESVSGTLVQVDIDGDGRSEMNFLVVGVTGLTGADFFL